MYSIRYQGKIAWHKEAGISLSFKKLNKKKESTMGAIDEYEHLNNFQSNSILSWLGLL